MKREGTFNIFGVKIEFGWQSTNKIGLISESFNGKKALIVTDTGVQRLGYPQQVSEILKKKKIESYIHNDISSNPTDKEVIKGATIYRDERCDFIIGIGGGSPMDAAKGISVMAVHDEPIDQYYGVGVENIVNPLPPMILIPTTAGTGSETSRSGIITNTAKKRKEVLRSGMANVALVDPSLTLGMPPFLTAATGLDALSHNIEALETNVYNPIAEAIAYEGIRLIAQSLVRAVEDGTCQSAREDMAMASSMGALAFQKGLCISHSIAHQISPMFGTHHGVAIAVTLPYTMEFNISAAPDKFSRIASAFGCADPTPEKAVDEVRKLIKRIQLPSSLSEIGVPKESLDEIAKNAMNDWCIKFNPKPVSEKDINVLCQQAFNNRD